MATARASNPTRARQVRRVPTGPERDRHLRVVPSETRRRLGLPRLSLRTGVVLTVLLFAALFAVAVSHALLIESQVRLDSLGEQVAAEQARYEELRREVAELESPERIVAEAQERLGMVEPNEVVWLTPDQPPPADGDADEGDGAAEAAASGGEGGEEAAETPDTSWANVKPYLETTR